MKLRRLRRWIVRWTFAIGEFMKEDMTELTALVVNSMFRVRPAQIDHLAGAFGPRATQLDVRCGALGDQRQE